MIAFAAAAAAPAQLLLQLLLLLLLLLWLLLLRVLMLLPLLLPRQRLRENHDGLTDPKAAAPVAAAPVEKLPHIRPVSDWGCPPASCRCPLQDASKSGIR